MKNEIKKIADDNSGLSFCIVLLIVAVFSVFIVGTYQILDRHVIENETDSEMHGAYYAAEGLVRLTSTYLDRVSADLAATMQEEAGSKTEIKVEDFIERLNNKVASIDFKSMISGDFDYEVTSLSVSPSANTSSLYTCTYEITAIVKFDDETHKKVKGTYGIVFNSTSTETATTNKLIINKSTSMLIALDDISADKESSLNGNVELIGTFTYPTHYPWATISGYDNTLYGNNNNVYQVDSTSLKKGNIKIPTIPNAPTIESFDLPSYSGKALEDYSTFLLDRNIYLGTGYNWTGPFSYSKTKMYRECEELELTNLAGISGYLTINTNKDDCYLLCKTMDFDNTLTINAGGDNFKLYVTDTLTLKNGGELVVNTNGNDVYLAVENIVSEKSGLLSTYRPNKISIETTGSGTVYIYINNYEQYKDITFTANITNESDVVIIFNCDFYVDSEGISNLTSYDSMVFNINKPSSSDAGDLKVFVIDDPDSGAEHYFKLYKNSTVQFNAAADTNFSLIADHIYMQGQMVLNGDATLNMYARETCELTGEDGNNNSLSNFTESDKNLSDQEKANKIIDTKLNLYYYGTEDFKITNYKACSNFYVASDANIYITNSYFYGNIFSSAKDPEEGERTCLYFENSYLSCGAIYAPKVTVVITGDPNAATKYETQNVGTFATCVFASITGTNILIYGNSMTMSSCVSQIELELEFELDYNTLVGADGETYFAEHFLRGIKEVK